VVERAPVASHGSDKAGALFVLGVTGLVQEHVVHLGNDQLGSVLFLRIHSALEGVHDVLVKWVVVVHMVHHAVVLLLLLVSREAVRPVGRRTDWVGKLVQLSKTAPPDEGLVLDLLWSRL